MSVDIVLGLQRGDEGKGRIVDLLASEYDIVARFNGGPNAGHTVANGGGEPLKLHQLPSGIARPDVVNVIGNGMLVDPILLLEEITEVVEAGVAITPQNLMISDLAHLILPHHISLDEIREAGEGGQGSTKRGIAFVASDKYERIGVRAELIAHGLDELEAAVRQGLHSVNEARVSVGLPKHDAAAEAREWIAKTKDLAPYITDTVALLHSWLESRKTVLAEGAQAFGLDIEFGMYPYVTSSHTTSGGAVSGLGIDPHAIKRIVGVVKVLKSHVGGGPFVTEITDGELATKMRGERGRIDSEYGASTGRERQVGYLDLPELRRAIAVNGVTEIALTKFDVLPMFGESMNIAVAYNLGGKEVKYAPSSAAQLERCQPVYKKMPLWPDDITGIRKRSALPQNARALLDFLSEELGVPISMIGVGPERDQIILA
ncbi:MAG TPA: adenylosuccinate synthase [Candidatus Saccharimonadales bacterium]|nr:adenylosuccinate synthase [Candidatus Saccharimonadales bacterium]